MKIRIDCKGTTALLQKNVRLADTLDPATRRLNDLTGEKKAKDRTPEDMAAISHAEFDGSLYWDEQLGPYVPTRWLEAALKKAGGLNNRRQGTKVQRALIFTDGEAPLEYEGPRDLAGLWADENFRFVVMANSNPSAARASLVPRTRPMFRQWEISTPADLDTSELTLSDLNRIGTVCGLYVGLGDWRPRFGRFEFNAYQEK
jgi:hypothetical protein